MEGSRIPAESVAGMSSCVRSSGTFAIIAGGGTAGHVIPGIAIAKALQARGHQAASLHFVGAERGIEARLVPESGFDITLLPGRGIQRRLTLENLSAIWGIIRAVTQSIALVRRRQPAVVLALGGFASVACAIAAVLWRVPLIIADQNARAGASNRLVARWAKACAVPFKETDLPRAVITGNPVREEILRAGADRQKSAAQSELGLPTDRTVIVVFAGSLGSRRLNEAVYGAVPLWSTRSDIAIHHVIGERDFADRPALQTKNLVYQSVRYEERMDLVLAAADLAICRSGGTTVAELAVVGVASILVPLPIATRDHQTANAQPLVKAGAAVLIADAEFDADRLVVEVEGLMGLDTASCRLAAMGQAATQLGYPHAADAVADLIEKYATRQEGTAQ
ncbi:MAG: UDP-N-acetylglucosamine--N-acetylmuramyl-(pentapeptide) pyrophosphoryl-undecaprenol N-acetylglucosamine transferase [Microthrixaceae bacterium]